MKKFNKILCLLLALAMMLSLVACGGGSSDDAAETTAPVAADTTGNAVVEYVNPAMEVLGDYDVVSETVYDLVLGDFYDTYMQAFEASSVSERQALMAVAEAKLMEACVMLPIYSSGGNYAISRLAPYTYADVDWGYSSTRYHKVLVTTELLKTVDRDALKAMWAELKGTGTYLSEAEKYLLAQGYELKNTYTTTYSTDLVTWDCLSTSRATEGEYCSLTWMGLYDYNVENELVPALAESYEKVVNEDGTTTYTFKIRKGAKWVDSQGRELGEVTADDWVAGMQHALDSMGGLEYLVQGIIKGVNEYIGGEITDFAEVGVKAVDDYTLEYTLEYDCSFFMTMLGYSIFCPLNRAYYESQGGKFGAEYDAAAADYLFATSPDNIAYCGPYLVTNVTSESTMVFSKNPSYYDVDNVRIETVTFLYNDGQDVTKSYYDTVAGTIDGAGLSSSTLTICQEDGYFEDYAYVTSTNSTSYMSFYNVARTAVVNTNDGASAGTSKTQTELDRTYYAMLNEHFRRALAFSSDRATYNAQSVGEDLKNARLRNSYTPATFVSLEEDVTILINGIPTTFEAGTWYGEIMQAQIDADGVAITVWDPEADAGIGSGDGYDGWYNPENAAAELEIAIAQLGVQGIKIDAENPIYIDYPYFSGSTTYSNKAQTWKQSIEAALGGCVVINLVECVDSSTWQYTGYYTNNGYESNFDIFDLSGWGPDYGDPQTYLDTFLPDYAGYMVKCIGLY